jgi:phosphoketolase
MLQTEPKSRGLQLIDAYWRAANYLSVGRTRLIVSGYWNLQPRWLQRL